MTIRYFETLPKPYVAFAKVIAGMAKKPPRSTTLPDLEFVVSKLKIDRAHLDRYNAICGFKQQGIISPTYLAVQSQALQMHMMTSDGFPFPVIGLVHIRNTLKQHRVIKSNETIHLSCKFGALTPHEKGQQFDFITTASVNGEVVWSGVTTYLKRGKTSDEGSKKPSTKVETIYASGDINENWSIPADIGRRYAVISGDFNPIHLYPLSAKLLGFQRTIAHGMWTKAKCLAALGHLPDSFEVDVQFKLPVLIPTKVTFKAQSGNSAVFELSDAKDGKPHIAGTITTLA